MNAVSALKQSTMLRWSGIYNFKPKISFQLEQGPYILKTAETSRELIECFRLRHEVFYKEFRGIDKSGLDFDKYDQDFDHLIIIQKESNEIIGTYRLSCSRFSKSSYTALEFDISELVEGMGTYLELGRACIRKDYRKGAIISLLWRGIAEYMNLSEADTLFGCSSVKIICPRESAILYTYLQQQGHVSEVVVTRATANFQMKTIDLWLEYFAKGLTLNQQQEAEQMIPSLLKSYLKLGAKVACEPAFDSEFQCIDFLTVLRREDLSLSLARRFKVAQAE